MNTFQEWIEEIRAGGAEGQHRAALSIAFVLTLIVAYFLVMYWYTRFWVQRVRSIISRW